jgi:hypothetical protein
MISVYTSFERSVDEHADRERDMAWWSNYLDELREADIK